MSKVQDTYLCRTEPAIALHICGTTRFESLLGGTLGTVFPSLRRCLLRKTAEILARQRKTETLAPDIRAMTEDEPIFGLVSVVGELSTRAGRCDLSLCWNCCDWREPYQFDSPAGELSCIERGRVDKRQSDREGARQSER